MNVLKSERYLHADDSVKKTCLKLLEWALANNLHSVDMVIADDTYYKKTLEQRRAILGAPSINYLCKTIILQNTAYDEKFKGRYYPQYICVVFQYITKFHSQKLQKLIRHLQNANEEVKASKKYFHYRLVEGQLSRQLSGYDHNGVVPIMLNHNMPIIVSDRIQKLAPQFFWMGGGHPVTKMRISLKDFQKSATADVWIGDVTQ